MTSDHPTRIRWGIASTGHIASVLARDIALLADECELTGVSSRSFDRAEAFATTYRVARAYGSVEDLAADPDIDVVYVASVHNDHFPTARACLEAGKAVLVEKPLTVDVAEADELIALAAERGLFLMEAVWTRTNPLIRKAVDLVRGGAIGSVRHVAASFGFALPFDATHRLYNPAQAGGAILDLGVYPVHGVQLFLGEPDEVTSYGTKAASGVDGHTAALLTFPATADRPAATGFVACSLETTLPTRLEVFGEDGSVRIDPFIKPERMELFRGSGWDSEPEVFVTQLPGQGYTFQIQEVGRCLRAGSTESPLVPWADTLATQRTLRRWAAGTWNA